MSEKCVFSGSKDLPMRFQKLCITKVLGGWPGICINSHPEKQEKQSLVAILSYNLHTALHGARPPTTHAK